MNKKECPNCGSPIASQAAGSITQWISSCKCFVQSNDKQEQLLSITVSICATCKKRIAKNKGSLTQWVFGKDLCSCNRPKATEQTINTYVQAVEIDDDADSKVEEVELEDVDDNFPKDRYKPLAELGRGTSGIVYLCRDKLLSKKVAVKTLSQLTDEQLVSFQNEAKATSSLEHPNLLTILDFGATKSGAPYMVSEYFSGVNLEKYLSDYGRLDKEVAKDVFIKLASVLEYVHSNGVFHRDIKPSNILISIIDDNFNIKLVDFGIAKVKEDTGHITIFQEKTLAGTPSYMAPDTAAGFSYDNRSEVYSLGCVLYECLTGEPLFRGKTALDILNQHMTSPAPELSRFEEFQNDTNWSNILDRCLAKDKDERYQSMSELANALESVETNTVYRDSIESNEEVKSKTKSIYILVPVIVLLLGSIITFQLLSNEEHLPEDVPTLLKEAKVYTSKGNENWEKAVKYLSKAGEKGNVEAQLNLAKIYKSGKPEVPIDKQKSFLWYQKAAANGNKVAKLEEGRCYRTGTGVPKNEDKAFNIFSKLAVEKYDKAQLDLAYCYKHGIGTKKDKKMAFYWYKEAAKQGSSYPQVKLGDCYVEATGVEQDYLKAYSIFLGPAKKGNNTAQRRLGWLYEHGKGVKRDFQLSFNWYMKAAKQGNKRAQIELGDSYDRGRGTTRSEEKAISWYQKAADQGSLEAHRKIGNILSDPRRSKKDNKKAIKYYLEAVDGGDGSAMNELGYCYRYGRGVEKNLKTAFSWYKKSAEAGSMWGKTNYATAYLFGIGVEKDKAKAFKMLKKAAENKANERASRLLGECYRFGHGTSKDYKQALYWYKIAYKRGDEDAWRSIGHLYYYGGPGLPSNHRIAFKYYLESANENHEPSLYDVGWLYEHGEGVKKDTKKAFLYYKKGSLAKESDSQARLGYFYLKGIETEVDIDKAVKLFKMTASRKSSQGKNYLAYCYEKGLGVKKNLPKAIKIYSELAADNYDLAEYNLGRCYENGIGVPQNIDKAISLYKEAAVAFNQDAIKALARLKKRSN